MSVNKIILLGNLGSDPETKYLQSGGAVTNLSIATSESWTDKQSGQKQERTEWHRVVFFNRLAEVAGEYLRKGSKVYIEGSLTTRKWQDKDTGADRYSTDIKGMVLQMLDSKPSVAQNGDQAQQAQSYQQQDNNPAPPPQGQQMGTQQAPQNAADDYFDDDIPF